MAMVGFSAAIINEVSVEWLRTCCLNSFDKQDDQLVETGRCLQAITGQTLWRQLAAAPFAYLVAYSLVVVGALLNRCVTFSYA